MRILVLNNYPFQEVWEEIKQGKKPAHHLYGVDVMEREGHEVILVPFRKSQFWMKLSKWISKIPFIEYTSSKMHLMLSIKRILRKNFVAA